MNRWVHVSVIVVGVVMWALPMHAHLTAYGKSLVDAGIVDVPHDFIKVPMRDSVDTVNSKSYAQ